MFQGMEYIYEVYKEKSFSKAAAALFISQPSLSANVKRVENRIGYPIFDRSTKPLQLTEVGKHYIQAVEKVMDIENNLENYLLDLGNLKTGTLNVGGSNFFSSWILPPLIADFSQKFPHVQISLVEESTVKLSQFLQAGKLDLVIDNCSFPGDAILSVEGLESRFAPSSGISAAYIMWCLSACIVEKMLQDGRMPTVFQSVNQPNGWDRYYEMTERYDKLGF